jgi:flagellar hook-associated protein 3 FlgL
MIQNLSAVSQEFLANLQLLTQKMNTTEAQVSSGVTISQPSDDPAALGDVLQLEADLGRVTQVSSNLSQVSGEVNTAEGSLETATQLLDQVQSLAAQGANSTTTAADRAGLSQQVENVLSQLVGISQTQYNGVYVFSGDQDSQPAYQLDLTQPNGVDQLLTAPATRQIQDATGITFADSLTATQIFDHQNPPGTTAPDNVFAAVNSLRVALANNDQTGINNAITSLQTASGYLQQQLAFYGSVQDQISNATDVAQKFQLQYQTSLGNLKDTDMATAAVTLTQEQTSMQAALQAEASMPRTSLFSFISGSSTS